MTKLKERDELEKQLSTASSQHAHAQEKAKDAARTIEENFSGELEEDDDDLRQLEVSQQAQFVEMSGKLDTLKSKCTEIEREIERAEQTRDQSRALLETEKAKEAHHKKVEQEALELIKQLDSTYALSSASSAGAPLAGNASAAARSAAAVDTLTRVKQARIAELQRVKDERTDVMNNLGARVQQ